MPLARVTLIQCDTAVTPDQGTTSGSQSHPTNFNEANLALAGATAREALLQLAADAARRAGRSADGRATASSASRRTRRSSVSYGELVGGQEVQPGARIRRRSGSRRASGRCSARRCRASTCRRWRPGSSSSCTTCACPACCTAASCGRRRSARRSSASTRARSADMPGVVKVVVKKNFVGVVAEKPWQAMQAAREAEGRRGRRAPACRRSATSTSYLRDSSRRATRSSSTRRTSTQTLAGAATVVKATYLHPYQMHGSIGSVVRGRRRAGRQGDGLVADAVGLSDAQQRRRCCSACQPENVRVIFTRAPAATASTAPTPCRTTRRCCRRRSASRCACSSRARTRWRGRTTASPTSSISASALDAERHTSSRGTTRRGRRRSAAGPATTRPGNVVTGMLAGFEPRRSRRDAGARPGGTFNNGSNAAPSYVTGRVGGRCGGTGTVASERVLTHTVRSPFFTGPLRSPARLQNTFAHESLHGRDRGAGEGRSGRVPAAAPERSAARSTSCSAAAKAANWDARPSPQAGSRADRRRAAAAASSCVLYEGDNGYVAMVAEVDVESGHRARHGRSGSSSRRTAGRSRIPTACATSSKAARCRA